MKIRVDFTLDVSNVDALQELGQVDDRWGAAWFVRNEALTDLLNYLRDNEIKVKVTKVNDPGLEWAMKTDS